MIGLFTLAVSVAAAVQAAPAATGLELVARTTDPNGRTNVTSLISLVGNLRNPQTLFVYVPKSVCDGIAVSEYEPARSPYGWRIFVGPVTYAPQSKAAVRADVMLTTLRMWNASGTVPDAPMFTALPNQAAERSAVIDALPALKPAAGCTASTLTLEARLLPQASVQRVVEKFVEAELWFVHKTPDGKESSQRQVVRMRDGGRGDFYFDDLNLTVGEESYKFPIVVEVFGTILTGTVDPDGDVNMTLHLTRRYVAKGTAFGVWPKTGKTEYPTTVKAGEVVSFVLPPLADDGGILLGHRFSVRIRIQPVRQRELSSDR
jgi:hypothetical protein